MNMSSKPTQSDLKTNLLSERIGNTTLYYSLVKKQGKTISFFTNDRLLIYDNSRRILFYCNDYKNIPFATTIPQPKNDVSTPLQSSTFKNPNNSNNIEVRYTGKNPKGEMETVEWNFTCETPQLTRQWMELLEREKDRIISQLTGQKGGGFIHDALLEAARRSPSKQTILKPEEQVIKTNPYPQQPIRSTLYPQKQPNKSNITEQPIKPSSSFYLDDKKTPYFKPQDRLQPQQNSRISRKNQPSQQSQQREPDLQESHAIQLPMLASQSVIRTKSQINRQRQSQAFMQVSQVKRIESTSQLRGTSNIQPGARSEVEERNTFKGNVNDWNMKFLRNPQESTILQFQNAANSAFDAVWRNDTPHKQVRQFEAQGLLVRLANLQTEHARRLKREFRNYHFILESCKTKMAVGVPLTCLIEWQGVVALVKAPIPRQCPKVPLSKAINEVRDLQRYTRVGNGVLEAATFVDTTEVYGMNGDKRLIFLDGLVEYLPMHADQQLAKTSLRPEYLLDTVTQIVPGGDLKPSNRPQWKLLTSVCEGLSICLRQLSHHLNDQQSLWADALQLKQLFHSFGVNMKLLPRVYSQLTNKHVKRQLMSVMVAKVAKELIGQIYTEMFKGEQTANRVTMVEDCVRNFIQGNTSSSSQFWKDLSVNFKKQYGIPIINSEIIGGFFLNSLIKLLRLVCDMSKLNKTKKIFKEQGIILAGFVVDIEPKSKSYSRFSTELMEKIKFACRQQKKDEAIYDQIVNTLELQSRPLPIEYSQGIANECILQYLSYYTPPKALDPNAPLRNIPIYASIFHEPPSAFTLKLTKVYLQWSIKKQRQDEFKRGIENALKIADYWLEETHLHHCALYELLSDFYASVGNGEESVNFMKEALSKCIRVCGAQSKTAGAKYYELGQRQLKCGHKKEALDNFSKARQNMESNKNQTIKYPQLLLRLASLQLNSGNIEGCIEGSLQAIRQFEQFDKSSGTGGAMTEGLKIKTFQVLSRAYEISGKREQLRQMSNLCAKKFNKCKSAWSYEQMVRICLSALLYRYPMQKCELFAAFINKINQNDDEIITMSGESALKQMMQLSQQITLMERFMSKFQFLEKVVSQMNSKRGYSQESKDFVKICKLIAGCVGVDFIQGLVYQKQFE